MERDENVFEAYSDLINQKSLIGIYDINLC